MQNLGSIRQQGAELWTDSHTKVSFAVPLLRGVVDVKKKHLRTVLKILKGEHQSLLLYVNPSISQPPVVRLNPNFACREQMGSSFLK